MARWRLTGKHYLTVPGNQWMHEETSRDTGKKVRKLFDVPQYLDPDDAADYNYPGEVIVAYEGKGQPRDIFFKGPPTPDMEPLDAEAAAISKAESKKWVHPIESLPGQGDYFQQLAQMFEAQLTAAIQRSPLVKVSAPSISEGMVPLEDFLKLQGQVAELTKMLSADKAEKVEAAPLPDDDEPELDLAARDAAADAEFAKTQAKPEAVARRA